jgi:hypothetical protein
MSLPARAGCAPAVVVLPCGALQILQVVGVDIEALP